MPSLPGRKRMNVEARATKGKSQGAAQQVQVGGCGAGDAAFSQWMLAHNWPTNYCAKARAYLE
jgi:hypothetical protein